MFLEEYVLIVGVALLALALVGAYLAYAPHVEPGTEVETVEDARWSSTGQYSHEATVQRGTEVFEAGTVLRNRQSYFQRVTPILNGSFFYRYEATQGGDLGVNTTLQLVLRSVGEDDQVYWRLTEPVGTDSVQSLSPGSTARTTFSTNVSAMSERVSAIDQQLGGTPGEKEIVLQSRVNLSGTRNGQPVDRQQVYEMQVVSQGNVYTVENAGPHTDSGVLTSEVVVTATYGPARSIGGPLLAAVALLGCLALAVGWYRDAFAVSEDERTWLAYTGRLREFDEWITAGRLPEEMLSAPRAPVDSLDGLVDVAIDSNRRVVEDRDSGLCAVLVDDVLYTCEIPAAVRATDHSAPLAAASPTDGDAGAALDGPLTGTGDDGEQRPDGQDAEKGTDDAHGTSPTGEVDDADEEDAAGPA